MAHAERSTFLSEPRAPLLLLLALAALHACSSNGGSSDSPMPTFTNPVAAGQDPWVVRDGGRYLLTQSSNRGIFLYAAERLTALKRDAVRIWTPPKSGWNRTCIWAPELHRIDGRWYVYYTAGRSGPPFVHQRCGVLQSVGDDPRGPYMDKGMLYTGDDVATGREHVWAIDLTVTRIEGQLYALWSGWKRNRDDHRTPQHLYIAKMSDPCTIASNRVRISSPELPWERGTELDLNEAPQFLKHDGDVFIVYSTRESWLPQYRLGQLRLRGGADPMDARSWVKTGPVFAGTSSVHGVGHASFTLSPDGTEHWIVYHSKVAPSPGWKRVLFMQPFTWGSDGAPVFGEPCMPGVPIPAPAGEDPAPLPRSRSR